MSNKFCRFLSHGASISIQQGKLVASPCCWSDHKLELNSDFYTNKNKQWNTIDDWTKQCGVCQQQEEAGIKSFRQSSFDFVTNHPNNNIHVLDINLDMTCNAACVICGPTYSTTWASQYKKFKIPLVEVDYNFDHKLTEIFDTVDFSQIKRIKFFGGEPLLTDTHLKVLKKITNPNDCEIWYTTNASVFPSQEVLDIWSTFKLVYFEASIDGVGEQFDYIRWPLKWNKVERNLIKLKEVGPINLLFRINHTLNPFNVYYYDRLENWVNNQFSSNRLGDPTEINIHPCWGDWALDRTPADLRTIVHNKYPGHNISNLLSQSSIDTASTIKKFTDTWDHVRQNNWRKVFPEIVKYFE